MKEETKAKLKVKTNSVKVSIPYKSHVCRNSLVRNTTFEQTKLTTQSQFSLNFTSMCICHKTQQYVHSSYSILEFNLKCCICLKPSNKTIH